MKNLKTKNNEIKTIYHLADIHCRNYRRQSEYLKVFDNLYNEIKKDSENAITCIVGDIAHSKTEMSPELVHIISYLFNKISSLTPLIIIAGNHDCNLNNKDRMDVISPIVNSLNNPNIYYLKDTGVYNFGNLTFAVSSVFDYNAIPSDEVVGNNKIALYHGTVNGAKNDLGFKFKNDNFNISTFDGYDMVLLGDIHKFQYLNSEKTIAFPGSLIQQNHKEYLNNHGMIKWNVDSRTSTFIPIENEYGYVTLEVNNNKITESSITIPPKPRIRLKVKNTNMSTLQGIVGILKSKYLLQGLTVVRENNESKVQKLSGLNVDNNISNPNFQNELIVDFLKTKYEDISDETLTQIKNINTNLNNILPPLETKYGTYWTPEILEYDNMFSYSENNVIDFTKLEGVVGIFGPNHSGKSSILDVLLFCLFDKCSRAYKGIDVLNHKKDSFRCKLQFDIDGRKYFIERTGKKSGGNKTNVSVVVNFWYLDGNVPISLNGDQRTATNKEIIKYIGDYNNFVNTVVSLQNNNLGFVYQKQSQRKESFNSILGIEIFKHLHELGKDNKKEAEILLKEYKNIDYEYKLLESKKTIIEKEQELSEYVIEKENIEEKIDKLERDIIGESIKIREISNIDTNIESLNISEKNKKIYVEENKNKIALIEDEILILKQERKDIKTKLEMLKKDDIVIKYGELENLKAKGIGIKNNLEKQTIILENHKEKLKKLGDLEYDENCNYCMKNPFTIDAIKTKEIIVDEESKVNNIEQELRDILDKIKEYAGVKVKYEEYQNFKNDIGKLDNKLQRKENEKLQYGGKIKDLELELEKLKNKINEYYKNEDNIKLNKEINKKILQYTENKQELEKNVKKIDMCIENIKTTIALAKVMKENAIESIKSAKDLEKTYQLYEYYLDAVYKDGVPLYLIKETLPLLEQKVNDLLSYLVEFTIQFEMDENNIFANISYDEDNFYPIELTSGFEKFVIGLAIRIALTQISNISKSNFIFIDEGWGNFDAENLASIQQIFTFLKNEFNLILIVSHIESLKDNVDDILNIEFGEFSKVNNS